MRAASGLTIRHLATAEHKAAVAICDDLYESHTECGLLDEEQVLLVYHEVDGRVDQLAVAWT